MYSLGYWLVNAGKFLCPNCFSTCRSFNHNLPNSSITSIPLASYVSLVILAVLYIHSKKIIFLYP